MKNLKISDESHDYLKNYCDLNNLKISDWISDKIINLLKNEIYLEIAPRGVGKTTRLINSVVEYYKNGSKQIVIVAQRTHNLKLMKSKLLDYGVDVNNIIFTTTMYINDTHSGYKISENGYKFFVDEYDYMDKNKLFISDDGYYCSTLENPEGNEFTRNLYKTYQNSILWKN